MPIRDNPGLLQLRQRFGGRPFRVSEAIAAGVSRTSLHRLRESGAVEPAGRGVVRLAGTGMGMQSELAVVSARAPNGTICLNSALSFWDLTDEIPAQIHLAVPRGTRRPMIIQPATKIHVFDADAFTVERQRAQTDADEPFWIYSPERSVVDAIRMSRWIGADVGLHALRRYMDRDGASAPALAELAARLGGAPRIRSALEALLS